MEATTTATEGTWVSVTDAAAHHDVSTRTVERWASAGKVDSRLSDQGRRLIRLESPTDNTDNVSANLSDTLSEAVAALEYRADRSMQAANVALDAHRRLVDAHQQELTRARRVGLVGWLTVAALAVAVAVGLWYGVHALAATEGRVETERTRAAGLADRLTDTADTLRAERSRADRLAADLAALRADRAELEQEQGQNRDRPAWLAWLGR